MGLKMTHWDSNLVAPHPLPAQPLPEAPELSGSKTIACDAHSTFRSPRRQLSSQGPPATEQEATMSWAPSLSRLRGEHSLGGSPAELCFPAALPVAGLQALERPPGAEPGLCPSRVTLGEVPRL